MVVTLLKVFIYNLIVESHNFLKKLNFVFLLLIFQNRTFAHVVNTIHPKYLTNNITTLGTTWIVQYMTTWNCSTGLQCLNNSIPFCVYYIGDESSSSRKSFLWWNKYQRIKSVDHYTCHKYLGINILFSLKSI